MSRLAAARPAALPPAERTVGQLVAESIRFYGDRFWAVLPLGLTLALLDLVAPSLGVDYQVAVLALAAPLVTATYLAATAMVADARWSWTALVVGTVVFMPVPLLRLAYELPAVGWLAFIGLAAPAAMIERLGFRDALVRGRQLGTVDYVHALASIATLVIVYVVASYALLVLLKGQADNTLRVAHFLSDLTLSPILFVGSALLYFDQEARLRSGPRTRQRS